MATINLIDKAKLEGAFRIEAEFYLPKYLEIVRKVKSLNHSKLSKLTYFIKKGIFDLPPDNYSTKGIALIRTTEIKTPIATLDECVRIPISIHKSQIKNELLSGDLVFTKIGAYIGDTSYLPFTEAKYNFSQNVAGAKVIKDKIKQGYLAAFLQTKYGREQIKRVQMLSGQGKLELVDLRNLLIFLPSENFQITIDSIYKEIDKILSDAKNIFKEATDIFYQELKLDKWKPSYTKSFERNFSDVQNAFRIDGEHYHPKFDELQKIIRKNAVYCKTIGSIKTFNQRGAQPKYFEDGTLKVINSQHILETHLDYDNFERTDESFWNSERESRVFKNDILIYTTGANIGRANVYLQDEKAMASNHTNILRVKDENPIYVGFALNSIVGRMQTEKMKTGSAQAEIYPAAFNQFVIPFIDKKKQDKISELYVQSYELSKQSKNLIAKAKQAVEIAIEQEEEKAMLFLKKTS